MVLSMKAGGLERVVHDLAARLPEEGIESHVGCLNEGGAMLDDLAARGIPTLVMDKRAGRLDMRLILRLRRYFREHGIGVLHSHSSGCMLYGSLAAAITGGVRVVHTDHGRFFPEDPRALVEERWAARGCRRVVAVSRPLAGYLASAVGIPRRKIEVILNGVDLDIFHPPSGNGTRPRSLLAEWGWPADSVVLGLAARFYAVKNIPLLLEVLKRLIAPYPRARLLLAGDGPERGALESLIGQLDLTRHVRIVTWTDQVWEYYGLMDIFTLCSLSEGTSMTILEAMASALPVVASRVGGNPDLVTDGDTGLLFSSENGDDYFEKLDLLLSRPELRLAMGRRGRERAEAEFGVGGMVSRYARLYRQLARADRTKR
jgi:glycosyltransferase involved in cell wall biosynthesis